MSLDDHFPDLAGWEPTRDTLALYAKVLGAIPRALAEPHPRWWHISLRVHPDGLITTRIPIPGETSESFTLLLNLRVHKLVIAARKSEVREIGLAEGLPASAFGEQVLAALNELGIYAEVDRSGFEDPAPREYERTMAEKYFLALEGVDRVFKKFRSEIGGETSPVQFWTHHFDLSFEWYGEKMVSYEEHGETKESPSQIGFGFAPGDSSHAAPYFYANPWPFDETLTAETLPSGARWFVESWRGSLLPYAALALPQVSNLREGDAGKDRPGDRLLAYLRAVYDVSAPTYS